MADEPLNDLTPLGLYNFRNQQKKFGIKTVDRRRHIYIVGKTGVGKTTLMKNMMIADIKAGKGVAVLDPHGEFAESLLDYIPEERMNDVIYFDPSDMEHPIAFNPMEQVGTEFRHLVASGIMSVFKKIWVDAWSARMEYILNNTLLSLLEFPGSTLLGVMRMFSDKEYRKQIVSQLQDPVIKAFWEDEFANYGARLESEALASIQNKVGQLVSNPLIRNIMGQPRSALNMREIMDTGKILLVNLSKGKIGEDNSALMGAMIITRFQLAAMSRVDIKDERDRRDFFLYVDEFQNFATDSFANILSEARKYGLSLVLAHQYIGQLTEGDSTRVRDAIFGNVGTIISFRVGATDAEFLEKEFMPQFLQTDLVNLSFANVYIRLMIDGVASQPFSAQTLPPAVPPLQSYRDVIIKNSQDHYGTLRTIVEKKIATDWHAEGADAITEKVARRDERGLSEMLREGAPVQRRAPRFPTPPSPMSRIVSSGSGATARPGDASRPRPTAPSQPPSNRPRLTTTFSQSPSPQRINTPSGARPTDDRAPSSHSFVPKDSMRTPAAILSSQNQELREEGIENKNDTSMAIKVKPQMDKPQMIQGKDLQETKSEGDMESPMIMSPTPAAAPRTSFPHLVESDDNDPLLKDFLKSREDVKEKKEKKQFDRPKVDVDALRKSIAQSMNAGEKSREPRAESQDAGKE